MAFPDVSTSLDTFTGGLGSRWTTYMGNGLKAVTVSSNGAVSANGVDNDHAGYYNVASYGPDFDVFATFLADGGLGSWVGIGAVQNPGSGTTDGYIVYLSTDGTDRLSVYRLDNDAFTQLGATVTWVETVGDKVGLQRRGSNLKAHIDRSGWSEYADRTDSTYTTGTFYFAMDIHYDYDSGGLAMDDLAGGTYSASAATVHRLMMMGCGV